MDEEKGEQYKNIDLGRIELEKSIKYMPVSAQRMTIECKDDIGKCKNYNELKGQLTKNEV